MSATRKIKRSLNSSPFNFEWQASLFNELRAKHLPEAPLEEKPLHVEDLHAAFLEDAPLQKRAVYVAMPSTGTHTAQQGKKTSRRNLFMQVNFLELDGVNELLITFDDVARLMQLSKEHLIRLIHSVGPLPTLRVRLQRKDITSVDGPAVERVEDVYTIEALMLIAMSPHAPKGQLYEYFRDRAARTMTQGFCSREEFKFNLATRHKLLAILNLPAFANLTNGENQLLRCADLFMDLAAQLSAAMSPASARLDTEELLSFLEQFVVECQGHRVERDSREKITVLARAEALAESLGGLNLTSSDLTANLTPVSIANSARDEALGDARPPAKLKRGPRPRLLDPDKMFSNLTLAHTQRRALAESRLDVVVQLASARLKELSPAALGDVSEVELEQRLKEKSARIKMKRGRRQVAPDPTPLHEIAHLTLAPPPSPPPPPPEVEVAPALCARCGCDYVEDALCSASGFSVPCSRARKTP